MQLTLTLSLTLLLSSALATAQPTLTAATSTPVPGFGEQVFTNSTYLAGPAGASQAWDFSGQSFTNAGNQSFEACNTANSCTSFPGTTVVSNTAGNYSYLIGSSSALSLKGVNGGGTMLVYYDPEDLFRFPISFGNSFVDTWGTNFTSSGVNFYRTGTDSTSADGWGTLKTPAGSFSNVLRIKKIQTYKDSANFSGFPFLITYKTTLYIWQDLTHKDYLYTTGTITSTTTGGPTTSTYSRYTSNQGVGVNGQVLTGLSWNIAPNPTQEEVRVSLSLPEAASVSLSLTDVTGRLVQSLPTSSLPAGEHQLRMPVKGLTTGVYMLQMSTGNMREMRRVVIQ